MGWRVSRLWRFRGLYDARVGFCAVFDLVWCRSDVKAVLAIAFDWPKTGVIFALDGFVFGLNRMVRVLVVFAIYFS